MARVGRIGIGKGPKLKAGSRSRARSYGKSPKLKAGSKRRKKR